MFNRAVRPLSRSRGGSTSTTAVSQRQTNRNNGSGELDMGSHFVPENGMLHATMHGNASHHLVHLDASAANAASMCRHNLPQMPGTDGSGSGGTVSKSTSKDSALNIDASLPASCSCSRNSLCSADGGGTSSRWMSSNDDECEAVYANEAASLKVENERLRRELKHEKDRSSRLTLLETELETIRSTYNDLRVSAARSERMQHLLRGKLEAEIARLQAAATVSTAVAPCSSCNGISSNAGEVNNGPIAAGAPAATESSNTDDHKLLLAATIRQNKQLRELCGRQELQYHEQLSQLQQQAQALDHAVKNASYYEERCRHLQMRCDQLEHLRHAFTTLQNSTKMREEQEAELRSQLQAEIEDLRSHFIMKSSVGNSRSSLANAAASNNEPPPTGNTTNADPTTQAYHNQQQAVKALVGCVLSRSEGFLHTPSPSRHPATPHYAAIVENHQQQHHGHLPHCSHSGSVCSHAESNAQRYPIRLPATATGGISNTVMHGPVGPNPFMLSSSRTMMEASDSNSFRSGGGSTGTISIDQQNPATLVDVDSIMTRVRMLEHQMAQNDRFLAHLRCGSTTPAPPATALLDETNKHADTLPTPPSSNIVVARHRDPAFSAVISDGRGVVGASSRSNTATALHEEHSRNASHLTFIMHDDEPNGCGHSDAIVGNRDGAKDVLEQPTFLDDRYCADRHTLPIPSITLSVQNAMLLQGVKYDPASPLPPSNNEQQSTDQQRNEQPQDDDHGNSILHRLRREAGLPN